MFGYLKEKDLEEVYHALRENTLRVKELQEIIRSLQEIIGNTQKLVKHVIEDKEN